MSSLVDLTKSRIKELEDSLKSETAYRGWGVTRASETSKRLRENRELLIKLTERKVRTYH